MEIFFKLFIIYLIGSIIGFIIEVIYRRFFSANKWINPGFLTGPYQPLYGFGVIILYLISLTNIELYYKLIIITILLTFIEYITGLIFIKLLNIKLWDYSNLKYNIQGIITPIFSLYWLILAIIYLYGINPYLTKFINSITFNVYNSFILGSIFMLILIDFLNSINFVRSLSKVLKKTKELIHYEKFKLHIKEKYKKSFPIKVINTVKENVDEFIKKIKSK